uniref:Wall-associated receptor kinase galacturonan-binding domain-containing protein n=1 Tax=Oryza barthii TaxID=65489 RepID=A0A0D3EJC3_9ORYZ
MAPSFFFALVVVSAWWTAFMLAVAAREAEERGSGCPAKCGNLNISSPFWITQSQMDRPCGSLDFQVDCNQSTGVGTLRTSSIFGFQIINISYGERTLLALDRRKLDDLTSLNRCQIPSWNTSAKLAVPFRISSAANLDLVFYNCTKAPPAERHEQLGLVETRCRNNSFARLGERYDDRSNYDAYYLEGCRATFLPALEPPGGKANASRYEELVRGGFLITWDLPGQGIYRLADKVVILPNRGGWATGMSKN